MSNYNRDGSDISWVLVIAAFLLFWPVGVFLLIAKLNEESKGGSGRQDWQAAMDEMRRDTAQVREQIKRGVDDLERRRNHGSVSHPYNQHSARERMGLDRDTVEAELVQEEPKKRKPRYNGSKKGKTPKIKGGKGLLIAGIIIACLFGLTAASTFMDWISIGLLPAVRETLPHFILTGIGGGMALWGGFKNKKTRQFRKLLNMIGDSKQIDIQALAEAVPCSYNRACDTLQDMIDEGLLGERAYIDMATGYLMLDGKGLGERKARKPKEKPAKDQQDAQDEEMRILAEIRRVNDDIPDPELSRKIDRIEEITRHILDYQKKHPDKAPELHKFLNYYLPTTLKILNSYAELDRQGVDGENISTTKERIERMMDKIVEGFETQLDKLFEGDMLDISSDISVMERMLSRDGLSGGLKMPKPGEPQLTLDPEGTAREPQRAKSQEWTAPAVTPDPVPESKPDDGWTAPVVTPDPVPESKPAESWTAPVTEPTPTPEPAPFTTPGGIQLTLTPDADQAQAAQAAPSWEDGFYSRTKEQLEQQ